VRRVLEVALRLAHPFIALYHRKRIWQPLLPAHGRQSGPTIMLQTLAGGQ